MQTAEMEHKNEGLEPPKILTFRGLTVIILKLYAQKKYSNKTAHFLMGKYHIHYFLDKQEGVKNGRKEKHFNLRRTA